MPQLTTTQCGDILTYLFVEGIKNSAVAARSGSNDLQQDLFNFLQNNGYTLPIPASRAKDLLGPNSSKQSIGRDYNPDNWGPNQPGKAQTRPINLAAANTVAQRMGFTDLQEMDNYTRNIKVSGKATVGTSSGSKVNLAGDRVPCRNLGTEFYDHNGVMSTNILSLAATGSLDPGFLASVKKVASGINYATEFPVSRGKTYILGDDLVHQMATMNSPAPAATPAPAPTPTPTPTPAPAAPAPTPTEEEPELPTLEEVVEESTPMDLTDIHQAAMQGEMVNCGNLQHCVIPTRSLSPTAWEERQNTSAGNYPYPLSSRNPIWVHLQKPITDPAIVQSEMIIYANDMEKQMDENFTGEDPWFTHGTGWLRVTDESITFFDSSEVMRCQDGSVAEMNGVELYNVNNINLGKFEVTELQFADPATETKIEKLVIVDNVDSKRILTYDSSGLTIDGPNGAPSLTKIGHNALFTPVNTGEVSPLVQINLTGWDEAELDKMDEEEYAGQMMEYLSNNTPIGGLYYFSASEGFTDVLLNYDAYESEITDQAGAIIPAGDLLTRVMATADETFDKATSYIKVFVVFDTPNSFTSDLYSGLDAAAPDLPTGDTLIILGDNFDLDLIGDNDSPVYDTLGIGTSISDRSRSLKSITTSKPKPALDADGKSMGFTLLPADSFGSIKMVYENNGSTETVSIPNSDGMIRGFDRNGEEVAGRVMEIQIHSGNPSGAWQTQKEARRQKRMSTDFNLPNPSDTTAGSATSSVAFSRGRKFYVVGRHKSKPVMIELDLSYGE
jgi:hypothetical protein